VEPGPRERGSRSRRGRRVAALAAVAALLATGGAGAALLAGAGDDPGPRADTRADPGARTGTVRAEPVPEPLQPAEVEATVAAGSRPNALVATRRAVYVASFPDNRLTLVDPRTNERQSRGPTVGLGAQALAAGFDSLWVAKARTGSLLRYDLASRRRVGGPAALPAGAPVRVAVGERAVWVGVRSRFGTDSVARFRPGAAFPDAVIEVPRGVQDLAVGAGAVWVTARRGRSVTRIDVATGARRNIPVSGDAAGVVVSGGFVWVVLPEQDLVARFRTSGRFAAAGRERVGDAPRFLDAGGGAVWVANELSDSLTRLDVRTGKTVETVEDVARNPRAVSVRGTTAWVASADAGTVTRVDFARPPRR
jgi:streptogramin lyase